MSTTSLKNEQWIKTVKFLGACPEVYVGQEDQCRRFIEGISITAQDWRLIS